MALPRCQHGLSACLMPLPWPGAHTRWSLLARPWSLLANFRCAPTCTSCREDAYACPPSLARGLVTHVTASGVVTEKLNCYCPTRCVLRDILSLPQWLDANTFTHCSSWQWDIPLLLCWHHWMKGAYNAYSSSCSSLLWFQQWLGLGTHSLWYPQRCSQEVGFSNSCCWDPCALQLLTANWLTAVLLVALVHTALSCTG